jgi:CTP:molybdopterin cytidylyltransferase MocA
MTSGDIAGLLLAAGAGRRMGRPKALVEHRGRLFVESAAAVLAAAGCTPVIVVLGAESETVRERADLTGYTVLDNPEWPEGMGASVRVGLTALAALAALAGTDITADTALTAVTDITAAVVLPVDVPGVTPEAVARIVAAAAPNLLVRASYDGIPGHPVAIGKAHWPGVVASAVGDVGARNYLKTHEVLDIPCGDVATGTDVDRPEDLNRLSP